MFRRGDRAPAEPNGEGRALQSAQIRGRRQLNVVKFLVTLLSCAWLLAPLSSARAATTIERGEYLVRAANCVSCHTVPGGQVFAGGVAFPTDFGTIYSTNITPDKATGIGSWTFEQFDAAVRSGVRPDGQHLYPAFPYTSFTKISDTDLRALYDYFMSLRPVNAPAKQNDMSFPYNQRRLLGAWNALFFEEGRFVPDAKRSEQWNRGAYLVEALAHCSACHSPRNFLGAEKTSQPYAGGLLEEPDEERGPVRRGAPNLTSSAHGLKAWSEEDLAGYLKSGVGSRARLMGTMNEVVLNSTRHLSEQDTRAMAVYLKSLPAAGDAGDRPSQKVMDLGAKQYDIHCGTCHLPTGKGSADTGPPLAGSAFAQAPDPSSLIDLVINGPRLPVPAPSGEWQRPWQSMTPFGQKLSDEQAAALLSFVRNSWGNAAAAVEPTDIDRMRY
jgi:mono/diheme cytochrome c family protein